MQLEKREKLKQELEQTNTKLTEMKSELKVTSETSLEMQALKDVVIDVAKSSMTTLKEEDIRILMVKKQKTMSESTTEKIKFVED